jgi:hypothetical protein
MEREWDMQQVKKKKLIQAAAEDFIQPAEGEEGEGELLCLRAHLRAD